MQYTPSAHAVNIAFLAGIFLLPVGYCLAHPSVPVEIGRTVIVLSFLLGAFAIADWYHFYWSNSFRGIFTAVAIGVIVALSALLVAALGSAASIRALATYETADLWPGPALLGRAYIAGAAVCAVSILSIPRLAVIRALSNRSLPGPA